MKFSEFITSVQNLPNLKVSHGLPRDGSGNVLGTIHTVYISSEVSSQQVVLHLDVPSDDDEVVLAYGFADGGQADYPISESWSHETYHDSRFWTHLYEGLHAMSDDE